VNFIQGDSVITDSIRRSDFAWLLQAANSIGFNSFPRVIARDPDLCRSYATDQPTVTVTIFRPDSTIRVEDYHGCFLRHDLSVSTPLGALRHFERQIDSVAHSERWVRPYVRRR
jgi:hypothetical protein